MAALEDEHDEQLMSAMGMPLKTKKSRPGASWSMADCMEADLRAHVVRAHKEASPQRAMKRTGGGFVVPKPDDPATRQITHPSIAAIFHPERDEQQELPYYEQGDKSMGAPSARAARAAMREHPAVVDAIARFSSKIYPTDEEGLQHKVAAACIDKKHVF